MGHFIWGMFITAAVWVALRVNQELAVEQHGRGLTRGQFDAAWVLIASLPFILWEGAWAVLTPHNLNFDDLGQLACGVIPVLVVVMARVLWRGIFTPWRR